MVVPPTQAGLSANVSLLFLRSKTHHLDMRGQNQFAEDQEKHAGFVECHTDLHELLRRPRAGDSRGVVAAGAHSAVSRAETDVR